MKCLSLKQPFAELIVSGKKTIEIRSWNTHFRGIFLIHASKTTDVQACSAMGFDQTLLTKGAIIGKANLYDVKEYRNRKDFLADAGSHLAADYINPRYGFLIKGAARLKKPIPIKGQLNFFDVDV